MPPITKWQFNFKTLDWAGMSDTVTTVTAILLYDEERSHEFHVPRYDAKRKPDVRDETSPRHYEPFCSLEYFVGV